jgi:predicted nucleotidyltransferase
MELRHYQMVLDIVSRYPYVFYAFGSRAKGNPKLFSDLDLCYKENIPSRDLHAIIEAFEESDLPFTVDIVDWNKCSDQFKELIGKDLVQIVVPSRRTSLS